MKASLRKDGRWEIKITLPGQTKRKSLYDVSEAKVLRQANQLLGTEEPGSTLYEFFKSSYWPLVEGKSESWKTQVKWALFGYVFPRFGTMELAEIKRPAVQQFFDRLPDKLNNNSKSKIRIVFSGVMNLAVEEELINRNPVSKADVGVIDDPVIIILTFAQLKLLIEHAPANLKPLIVLQGCCGLRIGEGCGVIWPNIMHHCLFINQQVVQEKGEARIKRELKTKNSRALVPLAKGVEKILEQSKGHSMFVSWNGTGYYTPNNVQVEYDRLSAALGIPRFTTHHLRHTYVTLMESKIKAPISIVSKLARKSSRKLGSLGDYLHPDMDEAREYQELFWEHVCLANVTTDLTTKSSDLGSN